MDVSNVAPPHISIENSCGQQVGVGVGDAEHVAGPQPGGQQRLVGVAERRVGEQQRLLVANPLGERLRAHRLEPLPRAVGDRLDVVVGAAARGSVGIAAATAAFTPGKPLTITSAA